MKKNISIFILLVAVSLLGLSCKKIVPQSEAPESVLQQKIPEQTVTPNESNPVNINNLDTELISLDQTWNLYKNKEFGFSIKVPKNVYDYSGAECIWKENNDHSYRSGGGFVPVKIIEEQNEIFIGTEYFYKPVGETIENGRKYYSSCQKVDIQSAYQLIENDFVHDLYWRIIVKKIDDKSQLDFFIKDKYGGGCSYGGERPSTQPGVYDVIVQGDGKPMSESDCFINYGTVLKYHPASQVLVSWDTGQAYTFVGDDKNEITYDDEMVSSFKFE